MKEEIEKLANELSSYYADEIVSNPRINAMKTGRWIGELEQELESFIYHWLMENVVSVSTSYEAA